MCVCRPQANITPTHLRTRRCPDAQTQPRILLPAQVAVVSLITFMQTSDNRPSKLRKVLYYKRQESSGLLSVYCRGKVRQHQITLLWKFKFKPERVRRDNAGSMTPFFIIFLPSELHALNLRLAQTNQPSSSPIDLRKREIWKKQWRYIWPV